MWLKSFLLLAATLLPLVAAEAAPGCKQLAAYAGSVAVERDAGKDYRAALAAAAKLPTSNEERAHYIGVVAWVYRYDASPADVVTALLAACSKPRVWV